VTLVKSILEGILVYWLSLSLILKEVSKILEENSLSSYGYGKGTVRDPLG
jgi:hypothetical protein